ncbi:unnamed protein product [Alopecurus aequalis]
MLQKDSKNICRTKVFDAPDCIKVPFVWPIIKFVPRKEYDLNHFLQFSLTPDPEDDYQTTEWGKFMYFLREYQKVGVVEFRSLIFHILAPGLHSFSAVVLYETVLKNPGVCKKMAGISGRSSTSEQTCDNIRHTKHMKSGLVPESSACNSVEDGSRSSILDPAVKKEASTLASNYVKTSPGYLRTLSQTHAGWIFGAIAELIDNSRDADGEVPVLCVVDNGHGMTYEQMMRMVLFGHDQPNEHCQDQIGRFGIGFKTGAMKLGKDALVLTQTSTSRSVSFLSQSFNENKINLEIPVVTYYKKGQYMEVDLNVQSKAAADYNLNAIKEYSPFNEYVIGEKISFFGEKEKTDENPIGHDNRDILIRSRRVRSRPGQTSRNVPLDYSLKAYLQVMFLNPQMQMSVQGSSVITCHLEKSLDKKSVLPGKIMGRTIHLTLGKSEVEWDRVNCGVFLYWHGRLIESYKRVGGQNHNAVTGRGIIGVADITDLIDDEDGFQDCEMYAKLEEWLGRKTDEYWNTNFGNLESRKGGELIKAVDDVVQCRSCRKCRNLNPGFNTASLPLEWFCHMEPFSGNCDMPEELEVAVITVAEKISCRSKVARVIQDEDVKNVKLIRPPTDGKGRSSSDATSCAGKPGDNFLQAESNMPRPHLKRQPSECESNYKKQR